jgi:hypothetical protein
MLNVFRKALGCNEADFKPAASFFFLGLTPEGQARITKSAFATMDKYKHLLKESDSNEK